MSRPFSASDAFRAIADPTRRRILELLRGPGMNPGEIAQSFSVTQPTLSFHLRVLRQTGLITARRRGRGMVYSLNRSALRPVSLWLHTQTPSTSTSTPALPRK